MNSVNAARMVARARMTLRGHALLKAYDKLPKYQQIAVSYHAIELVDSIAGSTQKRAFLRGDEQEDSLTTEAIYANGLLMGIRLLEGA